MEKKFSFVTDHTATGYVLICTAKNADGSNVTPPQISKDLTMDEVFAAQQAFYNTHKDAE
jgi:hypothetical protein